MKTFSQTAAAAAKDKQWYVIDAEGVVLGRLAAFLATRLRGKHKPTYTPNVDGGDNIVVVNAQKVRLTGNKTTEGRFYWHTGYVGGIKEISPKRVLEGKFPERLVVNAVRRMMKKDSPLARAQMRNLKVYGGPDHPHAAQQPKPIDVAGLNPKNKRSG
ncbi:MAG: 50S ribosomal protein L13 [Pseudomonadota bacterium]